MDLSTWTSRGADRARAKRLTAGVFVGIMLLCAGGTFIALTSKTVEAAQEEDPVAVELAKSPEPEPEPEPPPPVAKQEAPKPHAPKLSVPTTISDEKLEEKDPVKTNDTEDEPEEKAPPPAAPVVQAPVVAAPPPPPPKVEVRKPVRLSEDMPPPTVITPMTAPEYPAAAKTNAIEGNVVVKYIIGLDGKVRTAKALKGPDELRAACEAAVKSQRFAPYVLDGQPTEITKIYICKYKLR